MHILCEEKWKGLEVFSWKKKKKLGVRLGVLSVSYFERPAARTGISVLCGTRRSQTKAGELQRQVLVLSFMKNFINAFDLLTSPSCSVSVLSHASGKKSLQE